MWCFGEDILQYICLTSSYLSYYICIYMYFHITNILKQFVLTSYCRSFVVQHRLMMILTSSSREYVYSWVMLYKAFYKLSYRELMITQELVYRYYLLVRASDKMSKKDAEKYDPYVRFKKKDIMDEACANLNISFIVLRNYLKILKAKGVFTDTGFAEDLVPSSNKDTITVCLN